MKRRFDGSKRNGNSRVRCSRASRNTLTSARTRRIWRQRQRIRHVYSAEGRAILAGFCEKKRCGKGSRRRSPGYVSLTIVSSACSFPATARTGSAQIDTCLGSGDRPRIPGSWPEYTADSHRGYSGTGEGEWDEAGQVNASSDCRGRCCCCSATTASPFKDTIICTGILHFIE